MTLSLESNIASLNAQTRLRETTSALSKTFERLSSGLRINSAADDPAGLALADSLAADARLSAVAIRNANDGLSVTAIADAALDEIGNLLSRMAELAEQSSNGVYTNTQRSALSLEFIALGSEVERISNTTTFNDLELISGNGSSITLQVGIDSSSNSQISIDAADSTLSSLGLANGGSSQLNVTLLDVTESLAQAASLAALSAVNDAIGNLSTIRGSFGAAESRIQSAVNYITVARENFIAAESRIRDADIAQEVAELVRLQVLQQAGAATLAQANLQPEVALALLQ